MHWYCLLDSLVEKCWLRVREVPEMKKPNDHAEPTKVER